MAWNDRIRKAAYVSPSGVRSEFEFEDVKRSFEKRTEAFNFPDFNGTYVQDNGTQGRRLPIRAIFWGDDCDLLATAFETAVAETGLGRLEHPFYGTFDVVPFGVVSRRDDLKTAANQTIVDLVFFESSALVFPSEQSDPEAAVEAAVSEFTDAVALAVEADVELGTAIERTGFKADVLALLDSVKEGTQAIADTNDEVKARFDAMVDSVNNGIDVLIADPLTLAFQVSLLVREPGRALTNIEARLDAYANLATDITENTPLVNGNDGRNKNGFVARDLYAMNHTVGSITSVINNQFDTKPQAVAAAEAVLTQLDELTEWRDANLESLEIIDTGGAYQKLQEAAALTAGLLVQISFSLKQERTTTLTRSRTIIDLCAELYGEVDANLDFMIQSNQLTGTEILELPKGKVILYYV